MYDKKGRKAPKCAASVIFMSKKYKIKFECGEHPKFKAKKYKTN